MKFQFILFFLLFSERLWAGGPNGGLDSLIVSVNADIQVNDYAGALEQLVKAKPAGLAESECKLGAGRYCVTYGFSRDVPGINEKKLVLKILRDSENYVAIPGTSDTASRENEVEFQNAAESFAFEYNLHAQYWNEAIRRKTIAVVSLENTRAFIDLPKDVWDGLPLNSKLRIRYLSELAEEAANR